MDGLNDQSDIISQAQEIPRYLRVAHSQWEDQYMMLTTTFPHPVSKSLISVFSCLLERESVHDARYSQPHFHIQNFAFQHDDHSTTYSNCSVGPHPTRRRGSPFNRKVT
nr:hypothetical protein Iba_chr15cCG1490 [Ipomoea batatas]